MAVGVEPPCNRDPFVLTIEPLGPDNTELPTKEKQVTRKRRFGALMVLIGMFVALMPLVGVAQEELPNQCFAEATEYQYVKVALSGGTVPTDLAFWGPDGFSATSDGAGWFTEPQDQVTGMEAAGYPMDSVPTDTPFDFAGDSWEYQEDTRVVDGEQIPCFEISVDADSECGVVSGSIVTNNTPFPAGVRGVYGDTAPPLAGTSWEGDFTLPHVFEEDEGGGSVVVTVYVVGPEQDYYAVGGVSVILETVTVDTDCEDPETTTTTTVPEETTTTQPEETTTTVPEETTTTVPDTTTTIPDTDFICETDDDGVNRVVEVEDGTEGAHETRDEALEDCPTTTTTPTTAPPSTVEALPFTGIDNVGGMSKWAGGLLGGGLLTLLAGLFFLRDDEDGELVS